MGIDIANLGTALFAGVLVVFGTFYVTKFLELGRRGLNTQIVADDKKFPYALILLGCFGIGIVAEDLSWKYADDKIGLVIPGVIESDDYLKIRCLFEDDEETPTKFAQQLAQARAFSNWPTDLPQKQKDKAEQFENRILTLFPFKKSDVRASVGAVIPAYFQAKNTDSGGRNAATLTEIQRRIDFSRTCVVLCLLLSAYVLAWPFLTLLRSQYFPNATKLTRETVSRVVISTIVLLLICITTGIAYEQEEERHNLRVYGYYLSSKNHKSPSSTKVQEVPKVVANSEDSPKGDRRFGWIVVNDKKFLYLHDSGLTGQKLSLIPLDDEREMKKKLNEAAK